MKEKDRMKFVVSTVSENILRKLVMCKTSEDMLTKLSSMFGMDLSINKLYLQNKFYCLKCEDNIMEFVEEIDNISSKLEELGDSVSDQMKVAKVLNSLPKSYDPFITAFECASQEISFEVLRGKLMFEIERRNLKKCEKVSSVKECNDEEKDEINKAFVSKDNSAVAAEHWVLARVVEVNADVCLLAVFACLITGRGRMAPGRPMRTANVPNTSNDESSKILFKFLQHL
ncbi:hypothetical protein O3M35_007101 [Rhynocoris fuscipes]|uniref:Uncharacterized protein n=1 Tax=Rhynocoris fuscipes TaxID=488301 RepID=A0AAW1D8A0_9HEMI